MKKHNKLWKILAAITITTLILSSTAILNMCILYCYGITAPVTHACIAGSIAFVSLVLIPIISSNIKED